MSTATATRTIGHFDAIREAQLEEMRRDPSVILLGEDLEVSLWGTSLGFVEEFGRARVRNCPISELGFSGAAIGAAMTGLRPIVDLNIASLLFVAMDQIANQAAKARYMFGGQTSVPVVFRMNSLYKGGNAAHHSDRPHSTFMTIPGLKIIAPSNPHDLKGMLKSAIRDDDPVLCFEDQGLWTSKAEVPDGEYLVPLGEATVTRPGNDVTVVAISGCVPLALRAADQLAKDSVSVEVVDPRSLVPLDWPTILASVERTGRLVVADPGPQTCSAASEIIAGVTQDAFGALRAAPRRVATPDVPVPFSPAMELPLFPTAADIADAVRGTLA